MPEKNNSDAIRLGIHRVLEPANCLPQQATRLDTSLPIRDSEILIDVEFLNVDSASFHQFYSAQNKDPQKTIASMLEVISDRGKLQNPVTGSGGMLIGTVRETGSGLTSPDLKKLKPGDKIATLVSLTLTPLKIEKVLGIFPETERLQVKGHAILFDSGIAAKLPEDIDEGLALAALDVCGAPAQTNRLVKPGMNVAVIGGGGKSGLLCLYQAHKNLQGKGKVVALEYSETNSERLKAMSFVDEVIQGNARDSMKTSTAIKQAFNGEGADLVINVTNVEGTEMSSILSAKNRGTVYFFSMATSFTRAALGAEGVAADVDLLIGNGYAKGHAELTLQIVRESAEIRTLFEKLYET